MDGYDVSQQLTDRFVRIQYLRARQIDIDHKIDDVLKQMQEIPVVPMNIDEWIGSLRDGDKSFDLSSFKKMFKINKQYDKLVEQRSENTRQIKIMAIDHLLDRIKDTLKE
jgi:hypothetical protein